MDVEGPERVLPQKTPAAQTTGVFLFLLGLLILPEGSLQGNVDPARATDASDDITNAHPAAWAQTGRTTGNDIDSR